MLRIKVSRGFTLIEILIAMTIMSVMLALLFVSIKICADSWEKGEKKIFEVSEAASVVNFFQRHLPTARPLWNDFTKDERIYSFQGDNNSLQFVSAFPASAGRAGLQLFFLRLSNENEDTVIRVKITPFYPVADGEDWLVEDEILIGHVAGLALSYFGSENGETEGRWLHQWLRRDHLPKLVKIKIDLDNGLFWPEMTFALKMADADNSLIKNGDIQDRDDDAGNDGQDDSEDFFDER